MSIHIAGRGLVTALGGDLRTVWTNLSKGEAPQISVVLNPQSGRQHRVIPVCPAFVSTLARNPRLRRSSVISYYAVAAALQALAEAKMPRTAEALSRVALIFAVTDGGAIYTRRFYEQVVQEGAHAASPLLFPETVYNAPASHLAAELGLDGPSYTLVGDAPSGLGAIEFGKQLLDMGEADYCVIVACEEIDWILCEAYADWRLGKGLLGEGAAALVLAREGPFAVNAIVGAPFFRRTEAAEALHEVVRGIAPANSVDWVVHGEGVKFVETAVNGCVQQQFPEARRPPWRPVQALGEMMAGGALVNVILASLLLEASGGQRALAPSVGFNCQVGAALVERLPAPDAPPSVHLPDQKK